MKHFFKINFFVLSFLLVGIVATSCKSDDDGVQAIDVTVTVTMPDSIKSSVYYAAQTINLLQSGKVIYSALTDSQGVATFTGVIPDVYDISTSWEIDGATYTSIAEGDVQNNAAVISGTLNSQIINTQNKSITLSALLSVKQSVLISKVFYAGRKDNNSKNYTADQFIELFNNADETVNVNGLYIGILESESTAAYPAASNSGYVYSKQVFRIPEASAGVTYSIEPGATLLIVNSAIDHTTSASSSFDLTTANLEAKNTKNNNNPAVPALDLIYTTYSAIPSINFLAGGDFAVVIFKTSEDVSSWETVYAPGKTSGNAFMKIPASTVIDGVECLKNKTTGVDISSKRLYNFIDAGYQNVSSVTGYTGEVVVRKTSSATSSRFYLKDTNNTSNDFAISTSIQPGHFLDAE